MGLIDKALVSPLVKRLGLSKKDISKNEDLITEYSNNTKEIEKLEMRVSELYVRNEEIEDRLKSEKEH